MITIFAGEIDLASWLAACRFHRTLSRQFDRLTGAENRARLEQSHGPFQRAGRENSHVR